MSAANGTTIRLRYRVALSDELVAGEHTLQVPVTVSGRMAVLAFRKQLADEGTTPEERERRWTSFEVESPTVLSAYFANRQYELDDDSLVGYREAQPAPAPGM